MKLFKKPELPTTSFDDEKKWTIEWLRNLDSKEYDKVLKIVEIYREADEKVKVVELGSKKAVRESEKEERNEKEFEKELDEQIAKEFME